MKQLTAILLALILSIGVSIAQDHGKAGEKALQFSFTGLADLGVTGVNGGIGARYYVLNSLSIRATYAASISSATAPVTDVTGALLFDLGGGKSTSVFLGPTLAYEHSTGYEKYGFGAILGAEVFIYDRLSLGGEYQTAVEHNTESGVTSFDIGGTSAAIILSAYF